MVSLKNVARQQMEGGEAENNEDDLIATQKKQAQHYKKVLKLREEKQYEADKIVASGLGSIAGSLKGRK